MAKSCVIPGCRAPVECEDTQGHTYLNPELMDRLLLDEQRVVYYCLAHAKEFLFPVIDEVKGNTMDGIIKQFRDEGYW